MLSRRAFVTFLILSALVFALAMAGPRAGLLMAIGIGFGLVLEGLRFGFAGPWRLIVVERDGRGLLAQLLAIGLVASIAFPLLAANGGELSPAHAPVGLGMILGAFVFGAAMQLVMGCGSGTLVNAGSGNLVGLIALAGFIGGSFLGSLHLGWWTGLASLPVLSLQGLFGANGGLIVTLAGLAALAALVIWRASPGKRLPPARLWWAAALIAALALANLVVAGQPWGIVYGLGLWGAKLAQAGGVDVAASAFWANPGNAERLGASILTDVTSLTNIGLLIGAFAVMRWRADPGAPATPLTARSYALVLLAGLVLGYSARMAFGCNVGAFFSGISTGSLHGWVWLAAAFAGSTLGLKLRPHVLRAAPQPKGAFA
ncbi:YeeE/YedE family protein [Roseibaca sp. Y0-43]|uniref:YeeE/YedE family protein n=1 Tax=Roseibaca sp. Y0-43 TaxID=2816854 RepID=UPI001D0C4AAA|nr:YeeE/YedE family protein [Roseibaca sp. Y0-43]MCC1481614.1 YeeE/YedE family protein [Roseibaca sp. Y0-43]